MGKRNRTDRSDRTSVANAPVDPVVTPGESVPHGLSADDRGASANPRRDGGMPGHPTTAPAAPLATGPKPSVVAGPDPSLARWLAGGIVVHFLLIGSSYLAVIRPSSLQTRLAGGFAPYLRGLHLIPEPGAMDAEAPAEGVTFYLARGEGLERSYRLQFQSGSAGRESEWYDAPLEFGGPGSERRRRHSRLLATIAELGLSDQNALAARLMAPLAKAHPEANRLRIIRSSNLMTNVVQDSESPPYAATIIRQGDSIRFVREPEPRLGSAAIR